MFREGIPTSMLSVCLVLRAPHTVKDGRDNMKLDGIRQYVSQAHRMRSGRVRTHAQFKKKEKKKKLACLWDGRLDLIICGSADHHGRPKRQGTQTRSTGSCPCEGDRRPFECRCGLGQRTGASTRSSHNRITRRVGPCSSLDAAGCEGRQKEPFELRGARDGKCQSNAGLPRH